MDLQEIDQEVSLQEDQEESPFSQLSKQNSILSLTLDEFQCKSGKSFGSLNMEEFLASIWSSSDEAIQSHNNTTSVATEEQNTSQYGNSFSVPPPICKKTVDEVWSEIHKNQPQFKEETNLKRNETLKKQQTLGEMTLEDFFVKAGVVQQQSSSLSFQNHSGSVVSSNMRPMSIASYGLRPSIGMGFSSNGLVPYQMLSQNNNSGRVQDRAIGKCQNLSESSGCNSSKRIIDGPPEVVVERRQRRMLKNRESAARSRARRQAYTVELEAELNQLKEENEKLKQILAEAESKRKQELLQRKNSTKGQKGTEKLRGIRRPISATW